jgi:hypothetical protein
MLNRVLAQNNVKFGIFGGYAVAILGGPRESKDVDCLVSVTKPQILGLLDGQAGFVAVPQSRQDYVAFLWSEKPNRERAVLVEIFCEGFPGELKITRGLFEYFRLRTKTFKLIY